MILKFTAADMLNTSLVDVTTGSRAYDIVTILEKAEDLDSTSQESSQPCSPSPSPIPADCDEPSTSRFSGKKPVAPSPIAEQRQTRITDASGQLLAHITWNGRHPNIAVGEEKVGGLNDLFGSSTVRFMPKILAIPTRFDTEYIWTATADSLTLFDYDMETTKGTFHQNAFRIPTPWKSTSSSPPSTSPTSSSSSLVRSTPEESAFHKSAFMSTRVPGIGSNYLEFSSHPLAADVEIIISFIMMEILRRGRFSLTPYTFQRPKLWQLSEARDLVLRRIRRNTI